MRKMIEFLPVVGISLLLAGCGGDNRSSVWPFLLLVAGLALGTLAGLRTYSHILYVRRQRRRKRTPAFQKNLDILTIGIYVLAAVMVVGAILGMVIGDGERAEPEETAQSISQTVQTEPPALFTPKHTADSDPAKWGIKWEVFRGDTLISDYQRPAPISFGNPGEYFSLPGISAFRGNNYRNSASYGTAQVTQKTVETAWTVQTGSLAGGSQSGPAGSAWSGSGWTGQPLIVQWDETLKKQMNLYPEKQEKAALVEVIYATLDGHIYFLDLEDGSYTREPLNVGMCFKGAGTLDPRGYPLLYVGAGDSNADDARPRMYIISLIDGSILYEAGYDESIALRQDHDKWCGFDSSPLVDGATDTLIWPGENGLLYTIKLNTNYDKNLGAVTVSPEEPIIARYHTSRSGEDSYWYGYEASVSVAENYLYVSENGGMFYCVDLNTMELVWAQDTLDDSNSSPVLERVSEEEAYVYTAPSLHWTKGENDRGTIHIYKLDALTGQIVWKVPYEVYTLPDLSGGVQSTPVLGKPGSNLDGLVIYTISRIPDTYMGVLVALDTATGQEVWKVEMDHYSWSSPVAVYDENGTGYLMVCDAGGYVTLLDGATGQIQSSVELGGIIEASPAVFGNTLVVGTKSCSIAGVKIS